MYSVMADQVKNLKLINERKKDEHDNLIEALREMQSTGETQERLGKLYFIIMLSRWQEASINKKYEQALQDVRELRVDNMQVAKQCLVAENSYHEMEHKIQALNEDKERIQLRVNPGGKGGVVEDETKMNELNKRIQDMLTNLTDTEEVLMQLRTRHRETQD
jgi:hypothetical protein